MSINRHKFEWGSKHCFDPEGDHLVQISIDLEMSLDRRLVFQEINRCDLHLQLAH